MLYVGDSLRSDIFPSKKHAAWDTVMILEEMDAEVGTLFPDVISDQQDMNESNGKRAKFLVVLNLTGICYIITDIYYSYYFGSVIHWSDTK